jgi:hypothetical protein
MIHATQIEQTINARPGVDIFRIIHLYDSVSKEIKKMDSGTVYLNDLSMTSGECNVLNAILRTWGFEIRLSASYKYALYIYKPPQDPCVQPNIAKPPKKKWWFS